MQVTGSSTFEADDVLSVAFHHSDFSSSVRQELLLQSAGCLRCGAQLLILKDVQDRHQTWS